MEIKIIKEIKKNNDIHLTMYIDGKQIILFREKN
jgi:hypothetical protein